MMEIKLHIRLIAFILKYEALEIEYNLINFNK